MVNYALREVVKREESIPHFTLTNESGEIHYTAEVKGPFIAPDSPQEHYIILRIRSLGAGYTRGEELGVRHSKEEAINLAYEQLLALNSEHVPIDDQTSRKKSSQLEQATKTTIAVTSDDSIT